VDASQNPAFPDRGARVCVYPRMLKHPHASRAAAHALCSEMVAAAAAAVGRDVVSWLVSRWHPIAGCRMQPALQNPIAR
jgi:hypothetical protein